VSWGYVAAAAIGFSAAWGVQSLRWTASDLDNENRVKADIAQQVNAVNQKLIESRAETERNRAEYLEQQKNAKAEIDDLERRVAAGPERLYIKAKCPAVPATGADASGTGSGAAELDSTATRSYFALERGLAEQYGLLQLCRRELRKRSAQKAP
jgi:prophage endopeptidase